MNEINNFISNYLTETIAVLSIVILSLLYIIIKQRSDHPKDLKEHEKLQHDEQKHIEIFKNAVDKKEAIKTAADTTKSQEKILKEDTTRNKTIPKKRELVSHDPITKDSFRIFSGLKILVAEDNLINQKVINGILGDSGMQVVMANDGQEALDILKNDKDFSIVFMDAHMPVLDGFEATRSIRADRSLDHVLVAALSGDTAADDIKKMNDAGMQEHLEKPLKMEKLFEILYCYIDMKNSDKVENKKTAQILNIEEGIEICGSDRDLYKEVLSEFISMYKDADQNIKTLMAKDEKEAVKRLLLDISGISANIGADKLAEISTEFREVLSSNQEHDFFNLEKKFIETFSKVAEEIESYTH